MATLLYRLGLGAARRPLLVILAWVLALALAVGGFLAFGGTLSAMTDPFFMLASMHRLGKEYRIWDAAGEIKYLKPGRGTVTADMRIPEETYALIEEKTANGEKYLHWFDVDIMDEEGDIVAHVRRQV